MGRVLNNTNGIPKGISTPSSGGRVMRASVSSQQPEQNTILSTLGGIASGAVGLGKAFAGGVYEMGRSIVEPTAGHISNVLSQPSISSANQKAWEEYKPTLEAMQQRAVNATDPEEKKKWEDRVQSSLDEFKKTWGEENFFYKPNQTFKERIGEGVKAGSNFGQATLLGGGNSVLGTGIMKSFGGRVANNAIEGGLSGLFEGIGKSLEDDADAKTTAMNILQDTVANAALSAAVGGAIEGIPKIVSGVAKKLKGQPQDVVAESLKEELASQALKQGKEEIANEIISPKNSAVDNILEKRMGSSPELSSDDIVIASQKARGQDVLTQFEDAFARKGDYETAKKIALSLPEDDPQRGEFLRALKGVGVDLGGVEVPPPTINPKLQAMLDAGAKEKAGLATTTATNPIDALSEMLGVKVTKGKGYSAGLTQDGTPKIKIPSGADIKDPVTMKYLMHEVGHVVDDSTRTQIYSKDMANTLGEFRDYIKKGRDISDLMTDTTKTYNIDKTTKYLNSDKELFAEGFSKYVNESNEMMSKAPKLHEAYSNIINSDPKLRSYVDDVRKYKVPEQQVKEYVATQSDVSQIAAKTAPEEAITNIKEAVEIAPSINDARKGFKVKNITKNKVEQEILQDVKDEIFDPTKITNEQVRANVKNVSEALGMDDAAQLDMLAKIQKQADRVKTLASTQRTLEAMSDGKVTPEIRKNIEDLVGAVRTRGEIAAMSGRMLQLQGAAGKLDKTMKEKILEDVVKASKDDKAIQEAFLQVDWDNAKSVKQFYRKFVKPTTTEILETLRYFNMLSSPKTHIVNIASNVGQAIAEGPVKVSNALLDTFNVAVRGKPRSRFMGEVPEYYKGMIGSLPEAWKALKEGFTDESLLKESTKIADYGAEKADTLLKRSISPFEAETFTFRGKDVAMPAIAKKAGKIAELPGKSLMAMDNFFKVLIAGGESASQTYKYGKMGKELTEDALGEINKIATAKAKKLTFTSGMNAEDQGVLLNSIDSLTKGIQKLRGEEGPAGFAARGIIPFLQTPMNVLKAGIEYTPAGLVDLVGSKTGQLEKVSRTLIGTTVLATAYQLAMADKITFAVPKNEKQKELFYASGMQPYSIKVGNNWISYQKLSPAVSFPMAIAASMHQKYMETGANAGELEKTGMLLGSMAEYFADQSYVKAMGDAVDAVSGDQYAAESFATNFSQQYVPARAFFGWVTSIVDPVYRKRPRLSKDPLSAIFGLQQIPLISENYEAYTDISGKESKRENPLWNQTLGAGATYTTENPSYKKRYDAEVESAIRKSREKEKKTSKEEEKRFNLTSLLTGG